MLHFKHAILFLKYDIVLIEFFIGNKLESTTTRPTTFRYANKT